MKPFILSFSLSICLFQLSAQTTWNTRLPAFSTLHGFAELNYQDGVYCVSTDQAFLQVNNTGAIVGQVTVDIGFPTFWVWGNKISNPANPAPYYLLSRLTALAGSNSGYTIAHYRPGNGIINQVSFPDSLFAASKSKGPVFLAVNDSTLLVYGHKFIRKISHQANGAITEGWSKLMPFKTMDGLWTGSNAIFCNDSGVFRAFDLNGNLLWEKTQPFSTKAIKLLPDGIIGYGNDVAGEGLIFKLDLNGNLLWSKNLSEKKLNDLTPVNDGGIVLTGELDSFMLLVQKTDASGNLLWSKTYGNGKGLEIAPSPDGGVTVLWQATGAYKLCLAKIDALGNTVPVGIDPGPIRERSIHTAGVKTTQFPFENLFFDKNSSRLKIPADSLTSPVFVSSIWLGGNDAAGNLHLAASTYGNAQQDFRAGLTTSPASDFDRVWAVSRDEIARLRRDFGEDGDLDNPPPFDLLTWPAKGNPHFRQNLDFSIVTTNPDSLPAPFVDNNGDGIYNVFDGDYPRLLGDQMLWWARTDQTLHQETNGKPLGVDIFFTLYAYDCPQNGGISGSVFADYQIINRSGENYSDAYMGLFTDFDLGCYDDDYLGSLPETNSYYVYNQDAVDGQPGSSCAGAGATYGEKVPVESVTLLNHSMDYSMYYNRFGSPSSPNTPNEYYSYMQGLVCNGQLPTVGGTGCNPGSTDFTRFVFSDNPSNPSGWSMCTANLPLGDYRSLSSHGPFNFAAGDTFSMRLAFTFHPDIPHPCPDINTWVKPTIIQIQQWHDDGTLNAPLDLGSVQILPPGQSITLHASVPNAIGYTWSTGQNTPTITVNQTGEYTVNVTRASGCASTETVLVKAASGTSSPTLPAWQLKPNPANDVINIAFENSEAPITVLLRNAQGQTVVTKTTSGNMVEISVANLPTGLYWAELWQNELFMGIRKVVIAR